MSHGFKAAMCASSALLAAVYSFAPPTPHGPTPHGPTKGEAKQQSPVDLERWTRTRALEHLASSGQFQDDVGLLSALPEITVPSGDDAPPEWIAVLGALDATARAGLKWGLPEQFDLAAVRPELQSAWIAAMAIDVAVEWTEDGGQQRSLSRSLAVLRQGLASPHTSVRSAAAARFERLIVQEPMMRLVGLIDQESSSLDSAEVKRVRVARASAGLSFGHAPVWLACEGVAPSGDAPRAVRAIECRFLQIVHAPLDAQAIDVLRRAVLDSQGAEIVEVLALVASIRDGAHVVPDVDAVIEFCLGPVLAQAKFEREPAVAALLKVLGRSGLTRADAAPEGPRLWRERDALNRLSRALLSAALEGYPGSQAQCERLAHAAGAAARNSRDLLHAFDAPPKLAKQFLRGFDAHCEVSLASSDAEHGFAAWMLRTDSGRAWAEDIVLRRFVHGGELSLSAAIEARLRWLERYGRFQDERIVPLFDALVEGGGGSFDHVLAESIESAAHDLASAQSSAVRTKVESQSLLDKLLERLPRSRRIATLRPWLMQHLAYSSSDVRSTHVVELLSAFEGDDEIARLLAERLAHDVERVERLHSMTATEGGDYRPNRDQKAADGQLVRSAIALARVAGEAATDALEDALLRTTLGGGPDWSTADPRDRPKFPGTAFRLFADTSGSAQIARNWMGVDLPWRVRIEAALQVMEASSRQRRAGLTVDDHVRAAAVVIERFDELGTDRKLRALAAFTRLFRKGLGDVDAIDRIEMRRDETPDVRTLRADVAVLARRILASSDFLLSEAAAVLLAEAEGAAAAVALLEQVLLKDTIGERDLETADAAAQALVRFSTLGPVRESANIARLFDLAEERLERTDMRSETFDWLEAIRGSLLEARVAGFAYAAPNDSDEHEAVAAKIVATSLARAEELQRARLAGEEVYGARSGQQRRERDTYKRWTQVHSGPRTQAMPLTSHPELAAVLDGRQLLDLAALTPDPCTALLLVEAARIARAGERDSEESAQFAARMHLMRHDLARVGETVDVATAGACCTGEARHGIAVDTVAAVVSGRLPARFVGISFPGRDIEDIHDAVAFFSAEAFAADPRARQEGSLHARLAAAFSRCAPPWKRQ